MLDEYATTPARPANMVMPETAQAIFTFGNVVPLTIILIIAIQYARLHSTPLPFYLLIGGATAVLIEPIVDVLGLVYFPHEGSWGVFRAFDVTIPAFLLPVYAWYVGGQAFLTYRVIEKGVSTRDLFRIWLVLAVVNGILETPGLLMGVYTYYGAQPFQLLGFPWWWTFCNALMPIAVAALAYRLRPFLSGWRLALLVPLVPMTDGLVNGAVSWPTWLALNSGIGYAITYPAAILSFLLAVLFLFTIACAVANDRHKGPN